MKKTGGLIAIVLMLVACSSQGNPEIYTAGTYGGLGTGIHGDIKVSVEVSESSIVNITVTHHNETAGISDNAITNIPQAIISEQSTEVDTVSGATLTSNGIIEAVKQAVEQALK